MKKVLFLLFMITHLVVSAQTADYDLLSADYNNILTDTKTWLFRLGPDTLDATGTDDTLYVTFPHKLGTAFVGVANIQMDTIGVAVDLVGTYTFQTAQCLSCHWVTEASGALPAVSTFSTLRFQVRDIYARVQIIGTAGLGGVTSTLTIKPSSITTN